jgi:uncharacterized protein YndB with AHSA1/START domain
MKTWKKIALGVLGVIGAALAIVLVLAAFQPDTYSVERSRVIAASPERITPMLTDLRQWITWNPWDELEPTSHKEYSEPATGVGAWYTWEGEEVGAGRMEIASITATEVIYDLAFTAPFEDEGVVTITMAPEGESTRVTWSMHGNQSYVGKIFALFVDMDAMLGADFERGLSNLDRELAEPPAS